MEGVCSVVVYGRSDIEPRHRILEWMFHMDVKRERDTRSLTTPFLDLADSICKT